jgi:tRNA dimethylallyltransferase
MVDEVKDLLDKGVESELLIYYGLEYKYITLYLVGKINYDEMFRCLETGIHRFAKRQMTWFRGMERKGIKIHWLDGEMPVEEKIGRIFNLLA